MTAPLYTTDLTAQTIDVCEAIGSWVETGTWTTGTAPTIEPDFFIHGANCIAKYWTSGGGGGTPGGFVMDSGGDKTIPSPGGLFIWMKQQCPNNIATFANGGLRVIIGSSSTAFNAWIATGKDTYTYGGWVCYVIDPAVNGGTPDWVIGSPTSTKQWFGGAYLQTATAKGGTGIDVIRYGRGQLIVEYGESGNYSTFSGAAAYNDANGDTGATTLNVNASFQFTRGSGSFLDDGFLPGANIVTTGFTTPGNNSTKIISTVVAQTITVTDTTGLVQETGSGDERLRGGNRWGLFQVIDTGYLQQGLFLMGTTSNAVDFRDTNKNIFIANTKKVVAGFNVFEVVNALSRVDWTGINIVSLGTVSKGKLVITNNADINFDTCSFTDMDTFSFLANSTILRTTFRRCGIVTQSGAVFTNCKFDNPTGTKAMIVSDVSGITYTDFISSGTGYALEGFSSGGDYAFVGLTFTNYAAQGGTAGNRAIHVLATTGDVNITVSGGGNTPSYHSEGANVNFPSSVPMTVTIVDKDNASINGVQVAIYASNNGTELMNEDTGPPNDNGVATQAYTGSLPRNIYLRARKSSTGSTKYISTSTTGQIVAGSGYSVQITMYEDSNA